MTPHETICQLRNDVISSSVGDTLIDQNYMTLDIRGLNLQSNHERVDNMMIDGNLVDVPEQS